MVLTDWFYSLVGLAILRCHVDAFFGASLRIVVLLKNQIRSYYDTEKRQIRNQWASVNLCL